MIDRKTEWENEDSWLWKGLAIIVGIGFISFFTWGEITDYRFNSNHKFTIATTVGHTGGGWVDYEFTVNGVVYKRGDKGLTLKSINAKYFVKYYTPDPSVLAKIVSDDEVPDCIGEPPPNGWAELPSCE
ncbi:MAG: hypothetical protein HWD62_02760 [Cyclobacteriaceae bacterium]|nr:MAG: hypothetical protein HWD62_02760 [Cyclobacteriaceae bacterium]